MLTIVIPVYNRASAVASMLQSIEAQSLMPEEVIIVDNNSTDNTLQVISEWASRMNASGWRVRVISESTPGAAAARKAGERVVATPYVAFFDSDDKMHPDFVEKAVNDFRHDTSLKFTVWNLRYHDPDGRASRRRLIPSRPLENHLVQGLLSTLSYAVATDYLRSVGGWNPEIGGWDDWELGLRLLAAGGKFKVTDEVRAEITVQGDSITGLSYLHRLGDWEKTMRVMEDFLRSADCHLPERDRHFALRLMAYRHAILGAHYHHEGRPDAANLQLEAAMAFPELKARHRAAIRLAYLFTRSGRPGAGFLFPPLLRF